MTIYSQPVPGLVTVDHTISVPLDHSASGGQQIGLYAREVRAIEHADDEQPWLLYLQGGPGAASPRPLSRTGWLAEAVQDYRVVLLDQRGTGRSTPVTDRTPGAFDSAAALAEYLAHFRADSIVRDAELLRAAVTGGARWTTLGQSYGGWLTFTYLSLAPHGLDRCLVTGGVPGIHVTAEDVYRRTWPRVIAKNEEYARRFPDDQAVLQRLRAAIDSRPAGDPIRLPNGDPFTVGRLQALGIVFGMSDGYAQVHYLLETAFDGEQVASAFLAEVQSRTGHLASPLYAMLQEVLYCSGTASRWASQRVRQEFPQTAPDADRLLLIGEMKDAQIFRDEAEMQPFAAAMETLTAKSDWPALFDPEVLSTNQVPVAAAVYFDDMYVDADLSLATAAEVPNVRPWVTNEYEHDGLRVDPRVYRRVLELATGRA